MSWFVTNFIAAFLLPPLNLLLLAALGLWLRHRRPVIARVLLSAAFALLWLLSTPFVSDGLLHALEGPPQALDTKRNKADAIVVLGGGTYFRAPEFGGNTAGASTLVRLRYGAKLHRETGLPLLVTGGKPRGNDEPEAAQMKRVLEQEFNVPVRWAEDASNTTFENALLSRELLKQAGIQRIYLVTHAWHMPRAARVFSQAGFEVIPAPTAFTTRYRTDLLTFLPDADALRNSSIFTHELIGMVWYRIKS